MREILRKRGYIPAAERQKQPERDEVRNKPIEDQRHRTTRLIAVGSLALTAFTIAGNSALSKAETRNQLLTETYQLQDEVQALRLSVIDLPQYSTKITQSVPAPLDVNDRLKLVETMKTARDGLIPIIDEVDAKLDKISDDVVEGRRWWMPGGAVVFRRTQVLSLRRTFQRTNRQYEAFKQAVDSMADGDTHLTDLINSNSGLGDTSVRQSGGDGKKAVVKP